MVWLTGLPGILARTGYPVVEVAGWRTRGYKGRAMSGVRGIVPHHTATPWGRQGDYPSLALVRDGRADLPGPLAQLGLGRSGTWYVIAAGFANHAGTVRPDLEGTHSNPWAVGIEAEAAGTGDPRDWPEEQVDSYAKGCRALADAYNVPIGRVLGHKEICYPAGRKSDPSFIMAAFRARVAAAWEVDDVVTQEDRAAIAAETANAVIAALRPGIARAEDAAVAAAREAVNARLAAAQAYAAVGKHDAAQRERDAADRIVADDRWARRDRFNLREYGTPGVGAYADLAKAGTYLKLSGALHQLPVATAG